MCGSIKFSLLHTGILSTLIVSYGLPFLQNLLIEPIKIHYFDSDKSIDKILPSGYVSVPTPPAT
jgi:hypothetical protein